MEESQLSYIITTNASTNIDKKFWDIKKQFNLYEDQEKKFKFSIITLNIAHITIKRRFYLKENSTEEQLFSSLDSVIKRPIPINANTLELFKSERLGNVLVALVEKTPELQKLHEDVFGAIYPYVDSENQFEGKKFVPHLSIAYNIPDDKVDELYNAAQVLLPISYTQNNLYVLKSIPGIKKERKIAKSYNF